MANGTVKWFNSKKGYGFIQPDDGSKDVFVHISAVEAAGLRYLKDEQKVSYELSEKNGKVSAENIEIIKQSATTFERPLFSGLFLCLIKYLLVAFQEEHQKLENMIDLSSL